MESGRILLKRPDDTVLLDTDEKLFTVTDFVSSEDVGSISLPARTSTYTSAGGTTISEENLYPIAEVHSQADIVFGMHRCVTNGQIPVSGTYWTQSTGTRVAYMRPQNLDYESPGDNNIMTSLHLLTFVINDGVLSLHERLVLRAGPAPGSGTFNFTLFACEVDFRLYCGTFV